MYILETHTLRQGHLIKFTSYHVLNLLIGKDTFSIFPRNYIVYHLVDLYAMKFLPVVLEIYNSSFASCNLTYGYNRTYIYMDIFP